MALAALKLESVASAMRDEAAAVQAAWAATPIDGRLRILRKARLELARVSEQLVDAIPAHLQRTRADSYAAEVMPLLAAGKFLEREAERILKTRRLGRRGLPFWLAGVDARVERVPFGVVLVIAPSNYPLFLSGVQTLQALAAGNAVIWKPGRGGQAVAAVFARTLEWAGLPAGLLRVTDESAEAGVDAMTRGVDKVFFTGSADVGRAVLKLGAESTTPVVSELSGCDAVVVLPSADARRVVNALAFGMGLNGSKTCMAPRRLILVGPGHDGLIAELRERFAAVDAIGVDADTCGELRRLLAEARGRGAKVVGEATERMQPVLVLDGDARSELAGADIFAPVLTVLNVADCEEAIAVEALCPYGLTVAIFGERREAEALGARLNVGTVVVNDLIAPTADPRVSFGGRRGSGFGSTRGAEGLLEMTAVKVVSVQRGKTVPHYEPTGPLHEEMFRGVVAMSHGDGLRSRFAGLRRMIAAARKLGARGGR